MFMRYKVHSVQIFFQEISKSCKDDFTILYVIILSTLNDYNTFTQLLCIHCVFQIQPYDDYE